MLQIIVDVGLNDVFNGDAAQVVERLAQGVDLTVIALQVEVVVCTVPEVLRRK